jgi:hypothetical protein
MNAQDIIKSFENLLSYASRNTCLHEETYRGGTNFPICSSCGMRWADDEGGKPENAHEEPKEIKDAYFALEYLKKGSIETPYQDCIISGADCDFNTITVKMNAPNGAVRIVMGAKAKILI